MIYNAKNGNIKIENTEMEYVSFGSGDKYLVIIPGLGDALKTVKGTAVPFAWMYREFSDEYSVYIFSRKNHLEMGYSTSDMADEVSYAMNQLGIDNADIIGVSQGGMIAQYLAINYPDKVDKLVLAITTCRKNETLVKTIDKWIDYARKNDYKNLIQNINEKTYTEKRLKYNALMYPILAKFLNRKKMERFIIQANACKKHNAWDEINKIQAKTLIIGGAEDKIVGKEAAAEMASRILGSILKIYPNLGHGAYDEAADFNKVILEFLKSNGMK